METKWRFGAIGWFMPSLCLSGNFRIVRIAPLRCSAVCYSGVQVEQERTPDGLRA
jgi:hypothetical protein